MKPGSIDQLRDAIDALRDEVVVGCDQRAALLELDQLRAQFDAQYARRLEAFRVSHEWADDGARSPAAWISTRTRANRSRVTTTIGTARSLADLDIARAAWQDGLIGTDHATVIATVRTRAHADQHFLEYEPVLVAVARTHTAIETLEIAKAWLDALNNELDRDAVNADGDTPERARRAVTFATITDGVGILNGNLDTESAAIIDKALKVAYRRGHRHQDPRTPVQQRADALVAICSKYLDGAPATGNRPHLMIITDTETMEGETFGRSHTEAGSRVGPQMAHRYACNADINPLIFEDGIPLYLGRTVRIFTSHQHRVIMIRDGGCRGPGCDAPPDQCQTHHLDEWAKDRGATDIDRGIALCTGYCHRQVHEGGWTITGDANHEISFTDRNGKIIGATQPKAPPIRWLTKHAKQQHKEAQHILQRLNDLKHQPPNAA